MCIRDRVWPGDAHQVRRVWPGDAHQVRRAGPGDAHRVRRAGPGDAHRVRRTGPGDAHQVRRVWPADAHQVRRAGQVNLVRLSVLNCLWAVIGLRAVGVSGLAEPHRIEAILAVAPVAAPDPVPNSDPVPNALWYFLPFLLPLYCSRRTRGTISHGTRPAHGGIVANKVVFWNRRHKTGSE